MEWHKKLGVPADHLRFHDHDNLAHYANAAVDIEFQFPFGFRELEGIHSRTDFDLSSHQELSGKKLQYFDVEENQNYVPYVVETSIGCDRMFLAQVSLALQEETVPDADGKESTRTVMKLNPAVAPVKCAILPLLKNKEELTKAAEDIAATMRKSMNVQYEEKDTIGRRYRRQDAIGTPFCVTVDFETLENNTVTLRDRDTLDQQRVAIADLSRIVGDKVNMDQIL
jgi:glycyl-tRNA synthetase